MSLAHKRPVDSHVILRTEQTKEESKRHLTKRLEMAKSRYSKGAISDMSMIEISENGVVKKILVPLSSIALQNKKCSTQSKSKSSLTNTTDRTIVKIAPKRQSLEANKTFFLSETNTGVLRGTSLLTLGQTNQICRAVTTCASFVGLHQTNSRSSSGSFVQTIVINPAPIIINSNSSHSSGHLLSTTYSLQHPMVFAQKGITPNIGTSYILPTGNNSMQPVIRLPNQTSRIQLVSSQPALIGSNINPLNQSQLYLNPPVIQNAVVIAPQAKSFILNQTNQIYTQQSGPTTVVRGSPKKLLIKQPQRIKTNHASRMKTQSSVNADSPNSIKNIKIIEKDGKAVKRSKVKKILPKNSAQTQEELSLDERNLFRKLALAAEKVNNIQPTDISPMPLALNANVPPVTYSSVTQNVNLLNKVPLPTSKSKATPAAAGTSKNMRRSFKKTSQSDKSVKTSRAKSLREKVRLGRQKMAKGNSSDNYVEIPLKPKLYGSASTKIDEFTKVALGNQVPTVVLNPICIPPGVVTTKISNSKPNKETLGAQNAKMSTYRSIQPKPSTVQSNTNISPMQQNRSISFVAKRQDVSEPPKKHRKLSKVSTESESDYAIAQILDTDDSWVDDEDYILEGDGRKRKKFRSSDKSYKCYLGKSAELSKYTRTRSFFKSKKSHS